VIYDTPLAGARVRQPIRVTHSGEEGLIKVVTRRSVFFTCFEEGAHRKTGVSDRWCRSQEPARSRRQGRRQKAQLWSVLARLGRP
jgi:hypothetical protein